MTPTAARILPAMALSFAMFVPLHAKAAQAGWSESGEASWYGGRHQGRRTSSGEVFDQNRMTAAHPDLPLGSRVRVTMAQTGESVVVTVTDRLPRRHRVIDLSRGAASRIGLVSQGVGQVQLTLANNEPEDVADSSWGDEDINPPPRGRPHTPLVRQVVAAGRPCCRAPSAVQVRNSAQRPATRQKL